MAQQQPPVSQTQANVQQQASTITNGDEVLGPKLLQLKDLFPSSLRREDVDSSHLELSKQKQAFPLSLDVCSHLVQLRVRPNHVRRPARNSLAAPKPHGLRSKANI